MKIETESTKSIGERLQLCLPRVRLTQNFDTRIADLGLDSMDTVELLCVIHEEFGIRITEVDFHPQQTISGLLHAIAQKTTQHQLP